MISFPHFKTNFWVAHFEEKKSIPEALMTRCAAKWLSNRTHLHFFFSTEYYKSFNKIMCFI